MKSILARFFIICLAATAAAIPCSHHSFAQPDEAASTPAPASDIDALTPETFEDLIRMFEKDVMPEDILAAEKIIKQSIPLIQPVFEAYTKEIGIEYDMPTIKLYGYKGIYPPTACGDLVMENALYCLYDNSIYYDVIYLASLMKTVAKNTGTDGRYAPVAVVGHEMGHAADYFLKWGPAPSKMADGQLVITDAAVLGLIRGTEKRADCFSGAATAAVVKANAAGDDEFWKGLLAKDALLEGRLTLLAVQGDRPNEYYLSGNKRMELFKKGFENGIKPCHELGKSMAEDMLERIE